MFNNNIEVFLPIISSATTWIVTHLYHKKEKQSDLETKLTARIEDLTEKIIKLNEKYVNAMDEINHLRRENEDLKLQIELLKR